jgi:hypothetical protein
MKRVVVFTMLLTLLGAPMTTTGGQAPSAENKAAPIPWPDGLPVYDHVVIVVEENKDYDQIIDKDEAPFINKTLRKDGANFTQMFGEEHHSQGNYFWLFSGSNQGVGFLDGVPHVKIDKRIPNLASTLISKKLSFKGYSEDLPAIGSEEQFGPVGAKREARLYARKHVPWISFENVPNGSTVETSCNLRFEDFPTDYANLPTVAFVIPNLKNDMHDMDRSLKRDEAVKATVLQGDKWLEKNLGAYYQWAKTHNSLLIVTFDENDDLSREIGLTDPSVKPDNQVTKDKQNRVCTIFAGARIKPGEYAEGKGITHVNILRTLEAMHGLPRSGAQQPNAARAGIADDYIVTDVFEKGK